MRRPRIRFAMRTILFAVVLVAVNCWYLRQFYGSGMYRYLMGRVSYRVIPVGVGFVPLINVVLIGFLNLMSRRFQSWKLEPEADGQARLSALTFFTFCLLGLGALMCWHQRDTIRPVEEQLNNASGLAAYGWARLFGDPKDRLVWVIFDSVVLCILISGPVLMLAWIGKAVATRYSAGVSRRRFRVMTGLVSIGFAGTALAVCVTPQPFWEEADIALDLQILDEMSGRAIEQAAVRLTDPFGNEPDPPPSAFTDTNGRVRLTNRFVSYGERNAFWTMGEFSPWGRWLEVHAPGYRIRRLSLTEVFGPFADLARPGLGKISLSRGEATEPFRELAGRYINRSNGTGGRWMKIEPDGRFALCNSMCLSSESSEYGYLERTNSGIKLALFPCPGRGDWPEEYLHLRVVEWGGRRYLVSTTTEERRDFCRAALTPSHSPSRRMYLQDVLVLADDLDEPLTGLPRLPLEVWAAFLADEVNLDNEEGTLRLALDSLSRWSRRNTR